MDHGKKARLARPDKEADKKKGDESSKLERDKEGSGESTGDEGSSKGSPSGSGTSEDSDSLDNDDKQKKKSKDPKLPNTDKENEAKVEKELADKYWFKNGIEKDQKEVLLEKYVNPEGLNVPKLNPEILRKLPSYSNARDTYMCKRQELAGSALTAIGSVMTNLIEEKESIDKVEMMERLHDAGKLIVKMMHSQNKSRAAFIIAGLDKDSNSILENTKPEEFLFGGDLSEKFKQAQTLDKAKQTTPLQNTATFQQQGCIAGIQQQGTISRVQLQGPKFVQTHRIQAGAVLMALITSMVNHSPSSEQLTFDSRESIRKAFLEKDIPEASVDIILSSLAVSTKKQYESALKVWWQFCEKDGCEFYKPTRSSVISYLTKCFNDNASYALSTAHRTQTIASIEINNIVITDRGAEIKIPDIIKTSGPNRFQPLLVLPKFTDNPTLCVATALSTYLNFTHKLRKDTDKLFLALNKPHKQVESQTI
ncbi:hypothetical protein TSAR_014910, partial [Trichomalopsis sarcophagae]